MDRHTNAVSNDGDTEEIKCEGAQVRGEEPGETPGIFTAHAWQRARAGVPLKGQKARKER